MTARVPDDPGRAGEPADATISVEELVALVLERRAQEGPAVLDEVCARHPGSAAAVRARLARLASLGLLEEPEEATGTGGTPPRDPPVDRRAGADHPAPRFGPFELLRRLGGGGMGVVWLARRVDGGRPVALKLLRPELADLPEVRARFAREGLAARGLTHPSLVPVLDAGEVDGAPYLVMERVPGAPLDRVVQALRDEDPTHLTGADLRAVVTRLTHEEQARDADLADPVPAGGAPRDDATRHAQAGGGDAHLFDGSWEQACLRVAAALADALAHAHAQGVRHRDVKPANVIVSPEGRVVLVDFGLAAVAGSARLTASGLPLGSLAYMAPEVLSNGALEAGPTVDVYGVGVCRVELLGLRSPFLGPSLDATRTAVLEGRRPPLRSLNPAVSRPVDALCRVATDLDPRRRQRDAAALADDVARVLAGRPPRGRPPGAATRAWRVARRRPGLAASLVGALLLAVGAPVVWAVRGELVARELERALTDAERERGRAERHLDWAREAVETMLVELEAEELAELPGVDEVRTRIRERALSFYERFAQDDDGDPSLRVDRLSARLALGQLLRHVGRLEEAEAACIALYAESADHGGDPTLASLAADALTGQAVVCELTGRSRRAAALHEQALLIRREQALAHPDDVRARQEFGRTLAATAHRALLDGDGDTAQARFDEALAVLEALRAEAPDAETVLTDLVRTRHNHAFFLERTGRFEEARREAERVLQEGGEIADPDADMRLTLAVGRHGLAANEAAVGETARAEEHWRQAVDELTRLRDERPGRPDLGLMLGAAHDGLASLLARLGREDASRDHSRLALDTLTETAGRWPERVDLAESLAISRANAAVVAERDGDLDRARALLGLASDGLDALRARDDRPRLRSLQGQVLTILARVERGAGRDDAAREAEAALHALEP